MLTLTHKSVKAIVEKYFTLAAEKCNYILESMSRNTVWRQPLQYNWSFRVSCMKVLCPPGISAFRPGPPATSSVHVVKKTDIDGFVMQVLCNLVIFSCLQGLTSSPAAKGWSMSDKPLQTRHPTPSMIPPFNAHLVFQRKMGHNWLVSRLIPLAQNTIWYIDNLLIRLVHSKQIAPLILTLCCLLNKFG